MRKLLMLAPLLLALTGCPSDHDGGGPADPGSAGQNDSGESLSMPALESGTLPTKDAIVMMIPSLSQAAHAVSRGRLEKALDQSYEIQCQEQCQIKKASE